MCRFHVAHIALPHQQFSGGVAGEFLIHHKQEVSRQDAIKTFSGAIVEERQKQHLQKRLPSPPGSIKPWFHTEGKLAAMHHHHLKLGVPNGVIKQFSGAVAGEKKHFCKGSLSLPIFLFCYCFAYFIFVCSVISKTKTKISYSFYYCCLVYFCLLCYIKNTKN